ncbi:hypothetical protein C8Q70DRAFT_547329 [Cubamyces menziesii]|nr:hypothetical protein C8Q70DRAFT_547329 [Cubamyces menziesii]
MDHKALSKLTYGDLQKLAKRDGIRANQKKAQIVSELVQKYHPMLVPTHTVANTGVSSGSQTMPTSTPASLRNEARGKAIARSIPDLLQRTESSEDAQKPSQNQASPSAASQTQDDSLEDDVSSQSTPWQWGKGMTKTPMPSFTLRPATWSPAHRANDAHTHTNHSALNQRTLTPPTHAQLAQMQERDANTSIANNVPSAGRPRRSPASAPGSDRSRQTYHHPTTLKELQQALDVVAPLANAEQDTREQVREIRTLLASIGQRAAVLKEKGRWLQQMQVGFRRHMPELETLCPSQAGSIMLHAEEDRDEEEELLEVEEMTSTEVDFSDLVSTPSGDPEMTGYVLGFAHRGDH